MVFNRVCKEREIAGASCLVKGGYFTEDWVIGVASKQHSGVPAWIMARVPPLVLSILLKSFQFW